MLKKIYCFIIGHVLYTTYTSYKEGDVINGVRIRTEIERWNTYCTRCGIKLPEKEESIVNSKSK
jgi:hypothetical protein